MSGQLLEPALLMRAARQHQFPLSERRANQLSALLQTSRGVTLIGPKPTGLILARVILETAVKSGACTGIIEVAHSLAANLRREVAKGRWLLVAGVEVSALAGMVRDLEPYLEVQARPYMRRKSDWRAVLIHEPTRERRLPLPSDLMRHFPLFDVSE
jgi:hypothetical protein